MDYVEDTSQYCYSPGMIVGMFIQIKMKQDDGSRIKDEMLFLVRPCEYNHSKSSVFTTTWKLNMSKKEKRKSRIISDPCGCHCQTLSHDSSVN